LCLLFMLLSLYIFLKYWMGPKEPSMPILMGTGIFLGLALATKWAAISMFFMIDCLYIQKAIKSKKNYHPMKSLFYGFTFLIILPVLIYFTVYSWMFTLQGCTWHDIWYIQRFNLFYNLKVAATQPHPYVSFWWQWPLLLRPIWFYFAHQKGMVNGLICIGNPAIFWMIPVMISCLVLDSIRQRSVSLWVVIFGFLCQWLFYAHAPRTTFFHYFYYSMPFVAMGLAWLSAQLWQLRKTGRWVVSLYMILVFGMFVYWYPLLTGLTISESYYQTHIWLRSWI